MRITTILIYLIPSQHFIDTLPTVIRNASFRDNDSKLSLTATFKALLANVQTHKGEKQDLHLVQREVLSGIHLRI